MHVVYTVHTGVLFDFCSLFLVRSVDVFLLYRWLCAQYMFVQGPDSQRDTINFILKLL